MRNYLTMQVHPDQLADFDPDDVRSFLTKSGIEVEIQEGTTDEGYVNFNCWTEGPVLPIWKTIQRLFAEQPAVRNASIVCCTGRHGWDDYLLLHGASEHELLDLLDGED